MTTRVVIENGNDPDIRDWNVEVTEINSLGDPGVTHVMPPGDSGEFYIHGADSLRITEKEVEANDGVEDDGDSSDDDDQEDNEVVTEEAVDQEIEGDDPA
jgi:hypothetical protein